MPQPVSHSVDRLPGEGDDYMYLAKIQAAFQLDQDVLARLIRNIPSFIPGYWLTRIKLEDVIQDIARINGPFTCMDYDMASFHALQVADAAVNWYKPQNDGDLKHALEDSLIHLHSLHWAACSAKGWDAFGAARGWEYLMQTAFAQFLKPNIVSFSDAGLDTKRIILRNIVENTARWCFMALSLINRTQAILWLHENGYPFHYDVQGLTMHIFEKTVPPVKKIAVDNADGNQPAASVPDPEPAPTEEASLPPLYCSKNFAPTIDNEAPQAQVNRTLQENAKAATAIKLWREAGRSKQEIAKILKENGGGTAVIGALLADTTPPSKSAAQTAGKRFLGQKK